VFRQLSILWVETHMSATYTSGGGDAPTTERPKLLRST